MQTIIGLSGKKRSGKDTVARMIKCNLGGITTLAFAWDLKRELARACGVTIEEIESRKDQFRVGLQWWGTEFRREMCGDTYWIDITKGRIGDAGPNATVVITDVRFPNEARMVRDMGGYVVRVNRPAKGILARLRRWLFPTSAERHRSETALDNYQFDYTIENDGGLEDLEIKVYDLCEWLPARCHPSGGL